MYDWQCLNLQSLDLLVCSGNSYVSKKIKMFQRIVGAPKEAAEITHVAGIVQYNPNGTGIKHTAYGRPYSNTELFVEESTSLNKWSDQSGTQINRFKEWLHNYDGKVYVKQLFFDRDTKFFDGDLEFWRDHQDDPYESGIPGMLELLKAGLGWYKYVKWLFPNYNPKFTDELHCTELIAMRIENYELWRLPVIVSRVPPWLWYSELYDRLVVETGELKQIK